MPKAGPSSAQHSRFLVPSFLWPWIMSTLPILFACIIAFIIYRRRGPTTAVRTFIGLGLFGSLLLLNENLSPEGWHSSPVRGYQTVLRRIHGNMQNPIVTFGSFASLYGLVYVFGVLRRHSDPVEFCRRWCMTLFISLHFLITWLSPRPTNIVPALWHMVVPTRESYTALISVVLVPPVALAFTIYHQLMHRPRETGMPTTASIISLDVILKCAVETCAPFFGGTLVSLMPKVVGPLNKVLGFLKRDRVAPFAPAATASDAPVFHAWIEAVEKIVFISVIAPNIVLTSQGGIQLLLVALSLRLLKGNNSSSMFICDLVVILIQWNSIKYTAGFVTIGVTLTLWLLYGSRFFTNWTNNFGATQQVIFYSISFLGIFLVALEPVTLHNF